MTITFHRDNGELIGVTYAPPQVAVTDSYTTDSGDHIELTLLETTSDETGRVAISLANAVGDKFAIGEIKQTSGGEWSYMPLNRQDNAHLPLSEDDLQILGSHITDLIATNHHTGEPISDHHTAYTSLNEVAARISHKATHNYGADLYDSICDDARLADMATAAISRQKATLAALPDDYHAVAVEFAVGCALDIAARAIGYYQQQPQRKIGADKGNTD